MMKRRIERCKIGMRKNEFLSKLRGSRIETPRKKKEPEKDQWNLGSQEMSKIKDTAIVVIAYKRPKLLKECLASIRKFYPAIPIVISDNGTHSRGKEKKVIDRLDKIIHLILPFDCGANQARRDGLFFAHHNLGCEYAVLIEDDMKFTRSTRLDVFYNVLEQDVSVGMIGGVVRTRGHHGTIGATLKVDYKRGIFWRNRIDYPEMILTPEKNVYFYCDYIRMFFMVRREMEIDWEVGLYPSSGSHLSIMMKLLDSKYKKAWTWDCEIEHGKSRPTKGYAKIRDDYRVKARKIFVESMGLRYGIFNNGERVEDFLTGKKISMMELSRRVNGKIGMGYNI